MSEVKQEIENYDEWFSSLEVGTRCQGCHQGTWYEAEIKQLSEHGDWVEITWPGWGPEWDEVILKIKNRLKPLEPVSVIANEVENYDDWFSSLEIGARCQGYHQGTWYEAEIKQVSEHGDWVEITWPGWGPEWDEVILKVSNRLKPLADVEPVAEQVPNAGLDELKIGQRVLGESGGEWYDAEIISIEGDRIGVTWIGWDATHDEVIDRLSGRLKPLPQYEYDMDDSVLQILHELKDMLQEQKDMNRLLMERLETLEKRVGAD